MRFCLLLLAVVLTGCADVASLARTMHERQVTSCLFYSGSYGPFVGMHGITATGGATLDQCQALR